MEELIKCYTLQAYYFKQACGIADKLIKATFEEEDYACMHVYEGLISIHLDGMYRFEINIYDKSIVKKVRPIDMAKEDTWTNEDYEKATNKLLELIKGGA